MKRLLLTIVVLALPALAHAQAITSMTMTLSNGQTATLPASTYTCGVTPKTPAVAGVTNPTKFVWDDPANPTVADCVYNDPPIGGILHSLPFGPASYTATAIATNSAGNSGVSNTTLPFTRPGVVPTAPTGLHLARSWFIPWRRHYLLG